MKKFRERRVHFDFPELDGLTLKKLFRMVRFTTFIFLLSVMQVLAVDSYAQMAKLSLNVSNERLEKVLGTIEDESEFFFLYNKDLIDVEQEVSVDVENETIKAILDGLLEGKDIAYTVYDRQIVLSNIEVINEMVAQQKAVSGTVTDEAGEPLPGVTAVIKGTTQGTVTNMDGNYSISNIPEDATLVFSFVGMLTQEVEVGSQATINIKMALDAIGIEEVVAIGYGIQKKANLTGAVESIKTDELVKSRSANTSNALVGRSAGLIIKQPTGNPGQDAPMVLIRGVGTFQGNTNPAVIIDGVERSMTDFGNLDLNQVESINILKDAASAAVFGMRGANGVILVTTKRGAIGEPQLSYSYNLSLQSPTIVPRFTNSEDYTTIKNEFDVYNGQAPTYTNEEIQKFRDGSDPDRYPNEDWYDRVFPKSNAPLQQHNVKLTGGNEKAQYFASLGYMDQKGLNDAVRYKRYNLRSNIDAQVTKTTKASLDINGVFGTRDPNNNVNVYETYRMLPTIPAQYSNGYIAASPGGYGQPYVLTLSQATNYTRNTTVDARIQLVQEIPWVKGLSVKGTYLYGQDNYYQKTGGDDKVDEYALQSDGSFLKMSESSPTLYVANNTSEFDEAQFGINYDQTFGDHQVSALALFVQNTSWQNYSAINAWGFENDALLQVDAASEKNATGIDREYGRQSYVGRINYGFKKKYLIEGNIRRDGTENFAPEKRWGVFGAGSLAWIVSEEDFFKENVPFMEFLKIRGSYGTLGNDQIGGESFPYYNKFVSYMASPWIATYVNWGDYIFGGNYTKGLAPGAIANPNVTWEKSKKLDIGLDMSFLNAFNFTFDYFQERRTDILATRAASVPQTFGAALPLENIGEVKNYGFESTLGYNKVIGEVRITASANVTIVNNEIVFMDEAENISPLLKREGRPVDAYYGYESIGIFKNQAEIDNYAPQEVAGSGYNTQPGDVKYKDVNKDGVVNSEDRTYLGEGSIPNVMYGISGGLDYKGLDFSFLIQGAADVQVMPRIQLVYPMLNGGNIPQFWADNRWSESNPDAKYSSININEHNFPSGQTSSMFVYDASYIRLKNIEIGYTLPQNILEKVRLQGTRIYVGATNLLTFTSLPQTDPEINSGGGDDYPNLKSINFGINVDF